MNSVFFGRVGIMIIKHFVFLELIFLRVASAVCKWMKGHIMICVGFCV